MAELSIANPEEQRLFDQETYPEWGSKLSPDEYLVRQARLRATAWERAGAHDWVYRSGSALLSACTTYSLPASWLSNQERGEAVGIGNVFTPERYRGRGHATALLNAVMTRIEAEKPNLLAFFLFSDIDPAFYRRLGFGKRPAKDRVWSALSAEGIPQCESIPKLSFISEARDLQLGLLPTSPFTIPPTEPSLDWQVERERIYASALGRPRPKFQGARFEDSEILWAADYRNDALNCVHLSLRSPLAAEALIGAGRRVAAELGLKKLKAWEESSGSIWPSGEASGRREPRIGSIPMIRPLRAGLFVKHWAWVPRGIWI